MLELLDIEVIGEDLWFELVVESGLLAVIGLNVVLDVIETKVVFEWASGAK